MPQRVLIAMVVSLASCFAVPAMVEAQDCRAPFASRYPVAGPVNGGWDPTLERLRDATFNCEGRYSNSDYIASGGDAHHGNDFFAARGTPIVAVTDGVVAKAGFVSGLGYRVAIHDACGWEYDSGHLEAIASGIRVGLHVRAGDVLGTMGASGSGSGGSVHLHFNIHHSSDAWSDDVNPFGVVGHLANTACTPVGPSVPAWRAQVTTQSFPLAADEFVLMPGEEVAGFIEVRNTGRETWRPGEVNLGTAEPRDAHSPIAGPDWLSPARAATLDREVPAGGVGRFEFTVRAPTTPGEYPQFFNLVREGITWFSDSGGPVDAWIQVRVTVVPATDGDGDGHAMGADCDDTQPAVHPGAPEICGDGVDQDCSGADLTCPDEADGGALGGDGGPRETRDAGATHDAGARRDGGASDDREGSGLATGCSCRARGGSAGAPWTLPLTVLLALGARRRRR